MRPKKPAGFAIPSAIFLIVLLAILAAIVVTVAGLQHTSSARDLMGARSLQAARAGIDWGAYQVLQQGAALGAGVCPASPTAIAMPAGTDLTGLTVSVTCARTPNVDEGARSGASGLEFYVITANACNQAPCPNTTNPGPAYVERELQATIGR
jgi:MSHA biogenesis protein MshP